MTASCIKLFPLHTLPQARRIIQKSPRDVHNNGASRRMLSLTPVVTIGPLSDRYLQPVSAPRMPASPRPGRENERRPSP
jgi:hypothetical protein